MKKILLACVGASILLGGITFWGAYHSPIASIKSPQISNSSNAKMYSLAEEQILSAAEAFLYYKNLDELLRVDVKEDGNDFIITFDNPKDPETPKHELKMIRVADFNGMKQYKITTESWIRWAEFIRVNFPNPQITMDEYSETVFWVPDLSLTTSTSLKVSDIIIKDTDFSLTINNIISDSLVAPQNNKIDIASVTDLMGLNIKTPLFELNIPKIMENTQIIAADQTSSETMQALTAQKSTSSLMIPTFSVTSPLIGTDPFSATIEGTTTLDDTIKLSMRISDIKLSSMPTLPQNITANISLEGLTKNDIISYTELSEKYDELDSIQSPEAAEVEKQLINFYDTLSQKIRIKIDDFVITFPNGSFSIDGIIKYTNPALSADFNLNITNFDGLSPTPQPADKEACEKALENITSDTPMPPACIQKAGMLEFLRPFIDMQKRTINDEGQTVDTFKINYSADTLIINDQSIMAPNSNREVSIENVQVSPNETNNTGTASATLSGTQIFY
ncbi:MAG: hypothetical protein IKV03_05915 [Alphaproteobacteria bacterium]|nr:hypothetical protein [Alphaproteobacteria bacterium]